MPEMALGWISSEACIVEGLKHASEVLKMVFPAGAVDHNVVYVGGCIFIMELQDLIHHVLECSSDPVQFEKHGHKLKESVQCGEGHFRVGVRHQWDLPVSVSQV